MLAEDLSIRHLWLPQHSLIDVELNMFAAKLLANSGCLTVQNVPGHAQPELISLRTKTLVVATRRCLLSKKTAEVMIDYQNTEFSGSEFSYQIVVNLIRHV